MSIRLVRRSGNWIGDFQNSHVAPYIAARQYPTPTRLGLLLINTHVAAATERLPFEGILTVYNEGEDTSVPRQFDVVIERDSEGYYVASVPQIPACHTQARSLDEVTERIREAIEVCLEVEGAPEQDLEFVGIQRVTIAA